jgi:DNA-binding PadR family transcriptional regulator
MDRTLYSGLIRLYVLHLADKASVFGLGLIEELARLDYRVSAGTLYPMLHGLEAKGYLRVTERRERSHERKLYRITPEGRRALAVAKAKVRDMFGAFVEKKRTRARRHR